MKTTTANINKNLKVALVIAVLGLLTACGNSKSANSPDISSSNRFDINSAKPLAYCNKAKDANFSINSSIINDQSGQITNDWIKIKFNFLSPEVTKSGVVLKIFKWRVSGTQSILDPSALQLTTFDLASGQTVGSMVTSIAADQINPQTGLYIQLNDPNAMFQVLKVVAYDTNGQIVGNINSLIPVFNANMDDYKYNSDGSMRADILKNLHLLNGVTTTGWTAAQYKQSFDQYCF